MKYLDIPELCSLTSFLSSCELDSRRMKAKLEAYSCKQSGDDKKLGKQLEQSYMQELEGSPLSSLGTSPLGTLSDPQTRRLLISLICTMNASYPDYDFSSVKPEEFLKENLGIVVNSVNTTFSEIVESRNKGFLNDLWSAIDKVVGLKDCQVFSYIPDLDNDAFCASSNLWSFNYFFFNRSLKMIVFFACSCKQHSRFLKTTPDSTLSGMIPDDDDLDADAESTMSEREFEFEDNFEDQYDMNAFEDDLDDNDSLY